MWLLGALFILFFYVLIGEYLGSSFFDIDFNLIVLFTHGILLILLGIVISLFAKQNVKKIIVFYWVLLSIVPGGLFIVCSYNKTSSGGWVSFSWDWGLWELFLPIILGIAQIYTIAIIKSAITKQQN